MTLTAKLLKSTVHVSFLFLFSNNVRFYFLVDAHSATYCIDGMEAIM